MTSTPSTPLAGRPPIPIALDASIPATNDDFGQLLARVYDARKAAAATFLADLELMVVDVRLEVLGHRLELLNEAVEQ